MNVESVPNKHLKRSSFAISSILFIISAVVFYNWISWEIPREDKLSNVSGIVMAVKIKNVYKSASQLEIQVIEHDKIYNISQKDITKNIPVLQTLRQGDTINALVSFDAFGGIGFIWEIRRANEILLSREQVFELAKPVLSQLSLALMALLGAMIALFMPALINKLTIKKN